jgi:hypothetical protein
VVVVVALLLRIALVPVMDPAFLILRLNFLREREREKWEINELINK